MIDKIIDEITKELAIKILNGEIKVDYNKHDIEILNVNSSIKVLKKEVVDVSRDSKHIY